MGEAIGAGVGQWENTPKEWGQGWNAYGERFGSNLAYNGIRQTITYGTSVIFHEDNRYFASHKNGFWARTGYAALSTVVAQHPDGSRAFSVSSRNRHHWRQRDFQYLGTSQLEWHGKYR